MTKWKYSSVISIGYTRYEDCQSSCRVGFFFQLGYVWCVVKTCDNQQINASGRSSILAVRPVPHNHRPPSVVELLHRGAHRFEFDTACLAKRLERIGILRSNEGV